MDLPVRAVYHDGHLRLLDPVELRDGQQVEIIIHSAFSDKKLRDILGDSVRWPDLDDNRHAEIEAQAHDIAQAFGNGESGSNMIVEDRGEI